MEVTRIEFSFPWHVITFVSDLQFAEVLFCLFSDDQSERDADIFRGEVSLQRCAKVLY